MQEILFLTDDYINMGGRFYPHAAVPSFTQEVNPRLAKRPLKNNGRLANRGSTSLVKEGTGVIACQRRYANFCTQNFVVYQEYYEHLLKINIPHIFLHNVNFITITVVVVRLGFFVSASVIVATKI